MNVFGKKKSSAGRPALVTVPNVPLLEAGVEYQLSTGPTTFTPEDLRDMVTAANEDFAVPAPRIKIGHIDPRFNGPEYDGTPAFGSWRNLSLSSNGMTVYADAVGVPQWLADIMPTAYPSRSIECYWNVETQSGKKWRAVLSACSILGVTWPGVTMLEDLPQWYGSEIPEGAVIDGELVAARLGGDPDMKTQAAANLDDVRRAFYDAFDAPATYYWWIRAVMTDPNQVVAEDDETGQLYLIDFSSDASGNVSFGEPNPVRIDYVPDNREAQKAAASHAASALAAINGPRMLGTYASRAESRPEPTTQEGGPLDPKALRNTLGLPEDATDEAVQARLGTLVAASNGLGETDPQPDGGNDDGEGGDEPNQQPTAPPAPQATASGVVQLDPAQYEALVAAAQRGDQAYQRQLAADRNAILDGAIASGKFPPARRAHWEQALQLDFEGSKAAIESLASGLVPVGEIGSNGDGSGAGSTTASGYPQEWLPDVARRRQAEEAFASGAPRPRITREEG